MGFESLLDVLHELKQTLSNQQFSESEFTLLFNRVVKRCDILDISSPALTRYRKEIEVVIPTDSCTLLRLWWKHSHPSVLRQELLIKAEQEFRKVCMNMKQGMLTYYCD
jgi:hypothetical protein